MTEDPNWPRANSLLKPVDILAELDGSPFVGLVGCPLSKPSISPSNAHRTPGALREAMGRFSTYAAGVGQEGKVSGDLEQVPLVDFGDLDIADLDSEAAQKKLEQALRSLVTEHAPALTLLIGGDNAVTRGGMKAVCGELSRAGLITLDAHHDVRDYHDGPSNGTPVRGLIDDGLPGSQIVQIGLGSFTNSHYYRAYAEDNGLTLYGMSVLRRRGVEEVMTEALDRLSERCDVIYLDLDIDVLDRAFAPNCPGARPGGMFPSDLHGAAFLAGRHEKVIAVDFTEVDATADVNSLTVQNMALSVLNVLAGFMSRRGSATDRR